MLLLENHQGRRVLRRWELAIITLAICVLAISVATRTFRFSFGTGTVVKSASGHAIRQHMDRDATNWAPPTASLTVVMALPVFYPRFAPAGPPLARLYYEESLSNRPPPIHS